MIQYLTSSVVQASSKICGKTQEVCSRLLAWPYSYLFCLRHPPQDEE